jgi:alanine racemase
MMINQPIISGNGGLRPTYAEINLDQLDRNLQAIRARVAPSKAMAVVKANAYGHGLVEVAKYLAPHADYLGVAIVEEGILLREVGISAPILVFGGIWRDQIPKYIQHDLMFTVSSVEQLEQIAGAAGSLKKAACVHLKIDTGMERIGAHYYDAHILQEAALKYSPYVMVEGIYSHFANSDMADLTHARLQLERFNEVLNFYERHSLQMPLRHMANSGAILQLPDAFFDMVRPGILLYGYPSAESARTVQVKPALAWKSRVVHVKMTKAGHPVSYGSTWKSNRPVRIVTIPVGYGDGYFRIMSNKAQLIINGKKYPQVGRICMDLIMADLEDDFAHTGDIVTMIGGDGGEYISADDLAEWAGTIPYEILTNINTRVPRVYVY